jgi:hypothetical protein
MDFTNEAYSSDGAVPSMDMKWLIILLLLSSCGTHNVQKYKFVEITVNTTDSSELAKMDTSRVHQEEIRKLEMKKTKWKTIALILLVVVIAAFVPFEEI